MRSIKILSIIFLFCPLFINAEHDYIPFLNFAIFKQFNKSLLLRVDWEYDRYADSNTNYMHNEIACIYNIVPKHISSSIDYRFIKLKSPKSNKINQRIYFNVNFRKKLNKFLLSDNVGFEFRDIQRKPNILFLKNHIRLGYKIRSKKKSYVRPYVADRVYYDTNKRFAHINRFYFGIVLNHNRWLFINFQYYLESYFKKFDHSLKSNHNLGIQLTYFIPERKHKTHYKEGLHK